MRYHFSSASSQSLWSREKSFSIFFEMMTIHCNTKIE
jgi:hypothetical protein